MLCLFGLREFPDEDRAGCGGAEGKETSKLQSTCKQRLGLTAASTEQDTHHTRRRAHPALFCCRRNPGLECSTDLLTLASESTWSNEQATIGSWNDSD